MANKIKIDNALLKRQQLKTAKKHKKKKVLCRILIVCEGQSTEPNYFRKFCLKENIPFVYEVDCRGEGSNTLSVVDAAIKYKQEAEKLTPFDSVWAVFDRDNFPKDRFNAAIAKAEAHGVDVAWSNEAFELWYLYHFINRTTAMNREDYKEAISKAVNSSGKWKKAKPYKYAKNDEAAYEIMTRCGNLEQAIRWAQKQHEKFTGKRYADYNPCTLVYKLVEQLMNRDELLIDKVMKKIHMS